MDQKRIKEIFAQTCAIITNDHFVYAKKPDGWYHGSDYVNKDAIYAHPGFVSELCWYIACYFDNKEVEVVVGPAIGGAILSQWTAFWLTMIKRHNVFSVFAEEYDASSYDRIECWKKIDTIRIIKRGYETHVAGKRCLIVEDIINSGVTVAKTRNAITKAGGEVSAVATLCNRSGGIVTAASLFVPELLSLIDLDMKMYREEECPICEERGVESVRTDLGKGKEFLVRIGKS